MQASVEIIIPSLILNVGLFLFAEEERLKKACPEGHLYYKAQIFHADENNILRWHISLSQEDSKIT